MFGPCHAAQLLPEPEPELVDITVLQITFKFADNYRKLEILSENASN